MSVTYIPERIKFILWGRAAGRCQYDGCNTPLWRDRLTKVEFNTAYIAHIIADQQSGPRGDPFLSEKLRSDISNLMLMCDTHHRLIDIENIDGHPVELLQRMKLKHEQRIELLSSVCEEKQSHILFYGANIGQHTAKITWDAAVNAMVPERYPAEKPGIEIGLSNSSFMDNEEEYWKLERENLNRLFAQKVKPRLGNSDISHLSVFALAPQPLLIELGRLLSDILAAEVYQLHREPPDWCWHESSAIMGFNVVEPEIVGKYVALNLSLSATIINSRIEEVLGVDVSIWTITVTHPNNNFLNTRDQLRVFREVFRATLDRIKAKHGQRAILNIFPAVPVAIAVEIGRVWMPKADLPMRLFDQNRNRNGFIEAFTIGVTE